MAKSNLLTEPSEFRPIALTNTIGKIFFAVVACRMEKFFESNGYFSKVQKGFKAETPGCLEHSFAMFEALLDAKSNQRQVVLKNAYGPFVTIWSSLPWSGTVLLSLIITRRFAPRFV